MKLAFITGSYPPDTCGVGDYTYCLANELTTKGIDVEIISQPTWRVTDLKKILNKINSIKPDIVHIQYPTVGFGSHLTPQLISLVHSNIVTLHEVSQVNILRKVSLCPFTFSAKKIIFTTSYEREFAEKFAPWISNKSTVIPIGSSIPFGTKQKQYLANEIVYFGLIRPKKGLEEIIYLASLIKKQSLDYKVRIIGLPDPRYLDYLRELQNNTSNLPIIWNIGLSNLESAELLSSMGIAYLPFPDGASERRSSLLALLMNGVATITTDGKYTPREFYEIVEFAPSPEHALNIIQKLIREPELQYEMSTKGKLYANRFTWSSIAKDHISLYENFISSKRRFK